MPENHYKWIPEAELIRDVINGVCQHHSEKRLKQHRSDSNVLAADDNLEEQLL